MFNIKPLEWKDGHASGAFVEFTIIYRGAEFGYHLCISYPDSQEDYGPNHWLANEEDAKDFAEQFNREQLSYYLVPVESV